MRSLRPLAVVALLVGAGAIGWGVAGRGGAPAVDDGTIPEAVEEGAVPGLRVDPALARAAPKPIEVAGRGARGPLVVRVTAAYEPRAGVSVRVRRVDDLHPRAIATTDARGLARIPVVDRGVDVVEALAEGFRPTSTEREGFEEADGVLELTLEPGTPVAGRVIDAATGGGVEGASVVARLGGYAFEIGVVGPSGRFTIPGLWDGADAEVAATATGHAPARKAVALPEKDAPPAEVLLAMDFGGALVGTVVGSDGAPLSGVEVVAFARAQPPAPEPRPTSDGRPYADSIDRFADESEESPPVDVFDALSAPTRSGGAFRVDGLEPATEYEVRPRAPGLVPERAAWIRTSGRSDSGPIRITALRAATVRLRVTTADGDVPRETRRPRLYHGDAFSGPAGREPDGDVRFEGVRPGPVAAVVEARGYRMGVARGTAIEGETTTLTLALEPQPSISGTLVDDAGRPVGGTEVSATGASSHREARAVTDSQGRFRFRTPPLDEDVLLTASWWSQGDGRLRVLSTPRPVTVRAPAADVRVALASMGSIRLRVDAGGSEVPACVASRPVASGMTSQVEALGDGVFESRNLTDGAYVVTAFAPGRAWEERLVTIEGGRPVDLGEVVLPLGGPAKVRVLDSRGRPVAGARVVSTALQQHFTLGGIPEACREAWTTTNAEGLAVLPHLPAGRSLEFEVSAESCSSAGVDLAAGSETPAEVRLERNAVLEGVVQAPPAIDLKAETIEFRRAGAGEDDPETELVDLNEAGRFSVVLPPGKWTAVFTDRTGAKHVLGSWTLAEGAEVRDVVLRLPGS